MNHQQDIPSGLLPQKNIVNTGMKYLNPQGSMISTRSVETGKKKASTKSHEQQKERIQKIKRTGHILYHFSGVGFLGPLSKQKVSSQNKVAFCIVLGEYPQSGMISLIMTMSILVSQRCSSCSMSTSPDNCKREELVCV